MDRKAQLNKMLSTVSRPTPKLGTQDDRVKRNNTTCNATCFIRTATEASAEESIKPCPPAQERPKNLGRSSKHSRGSDALNLTTIVAPATASDNPRYCYREGNSNKKEKDVKEKPEMALTEDISDEELKTVQQQRKIKLKRETIGDIRLGFDKGHKDDKMELKPEYMAKNKPETKSETKQEPATKRKRNSVDDDSVLIGSERSARGQPVTVKPQSIAIDKIASTDTYYKIAKSPFADVVDGSLSEYLGNRSFVSNINKSSGVDTAKLSMFRKTNENVLSQANRTTMGCESQSHNHDVAIVAGNAKKVEQIIKIDSSLDSFDSASVNASEAESYKEFVKGLV